MSDSLSKICNQCFTIDPNGLTSEVSAFGARQELEGKPDAGINNTLEVKI